MAESLAIDASEFRAIFGVNPDENDDVNNSENEFQGFELSSEEESSSSEEESEDESDEDSVKNWSEQLTHFDLEDFTGQQRLKKTVSEDAKAEDYFSLMFSDELIGLISDETNRYAQFIIGQKADREARLAEWKDVTPDELCMFLGVVLSMGINSLPQQALYWSQNPLFGNLGIQDVIPKTRFEEIAQLLHFSDPNNEPQHGDADYDRLFKVRPVLSDVLKNIQQAYGPSKDKSVDEGMIAFKGRLCFRQYMPAKPMKYGIKVWMAADANNGYV